MTAPLHLKPGQRLLIEDPSQLFFIEEGTVDIMVVCHDPKETDPSVGLMSFLCSFSKGDLFGGLPPPAGKPFRSIALAQEAAVLRQESWQNISRQPSPPLQLTQRWIARMGRFFSSLSTTDIDLWLEEGECTLPMGQIAGIVPHAGQKAEETVQWVEIKTGSIQLFGLTAFTLEKEKILLPLSPALWFTSECPTTLMVLKTEAAISHPLFWQTIPQLGQLFTALVNLLLQTRTITFKKWQEAQQKEDRELLEDALEALSEVYTKAPEITFTHGAGAILKACQTLGAMIGIQFLSPKQKVFGSFTSAVQAICQESNIFYRDVLLEKEWYKQDSLPILVEQKENHKPWVALFNDRLNRMELFDPETKQRVRVTKEIAETLNEQAFVFYEPLPEAPFSVKKTLRFCLRGRRNDIFLLFFFGTIGALISLIPSFLMRTLVDNVIEGGERNLLPQIVIALVVVALMSSLFLFARSYTALRFSQFIALRVRCAVWARVMHLPIKFVRRFTTGEFIQRVYAISRIHQLLSNNVIRVLLSGFFSLFYLVAMFYFSPTLTWIGLGIIAVSLVILGFCLYFRIGWNRRFYSLVQALEGFVLQLIDGIEKLRLTGAENRAFAEWGLRFARVQRSRFGSQRIDVIEDTVSAIFPPLSYALLFGGAIWILLNAPLFAPSLTIGTVIAFLAAYTPFSSAIFDMTDTIVELAPVIPLWERTRVIFEAETENTENKTSPGRLLGGIAVDNVSFRYEPEDPLVLENISFHADPGECVGIVGHSGSGKSTLIRLLLGFETAQSGSIFYDGKNINDLILKELRAQIGTVLQDGGLFSGSVYQNIVCGGTYSQEQLERAFQLSGFDKDLNDLPMGLNTVVQSGSSSFCGGQLQRLLIARALIAEPAILLLDEATASLDNEAQRVIGENLEKMKVTRIIIAHRLTTMRYTDRIYVLDKGRMIQSGTFAELSSQEGHFKEMLKKQSIAV